MSIQAALFASRIDNYIFAARNGALSDEGLPIYVFQSGLAHLHGGEIGFDVHPVHSLHLSSAFSCVFAREAGGDNLPLIPAPRLFSEIKWEISHDGKLFNNAFVAMNLDWNLRQDRFYGKDATSLYLIGTNLTDTVYVPHLSRLKDIGIYNMGRNIVLKLEIPF